jgi:hypothetical protein
VDGSRSLTARFEWRNRLPFEFRSRWTGRLKIERYPAYRKALNEQIANIKHPRNQTFSGRNAILTVAARFMHVTRARGVAFAVRLFWTPTRSREREMNASEKSLRLVVEKWFAPTPAMPVHVTEFGRTTSTQRRYVRIEALRPAGPLAIFFFQHDDGSWNVFPPIAVMPAMRACRLAA